MHGNKHVDMLQWLIFTYLFTTEYSSEQKLLESNLP